MIESGTLVENHQFAAVTVPFGGWRRERRLRRGPVTRYYYVTVHDYSTLLLPSLYDLGTGKYRSLWCHWRNWDAYCMQKLNNTYITQRLRTGTCALCFFTDRLALAAVGPAWNHSDEARTWLGCRSLCIASMMIRPHSLLIYSENFLGSCSPLRFQVLDSTSSSLLLAAAILNLLLFLA